MSKELNINPKFQSLYNGYKHNHNPDFVLKNIFEIYLPFWFCKTSVVVERDLELDRFSKIILQLIQVGTKKHSKICSFLGIDTNSFVTTQFHFLLTHGMISEVLLPDDSEYSLTHQGIAFLEKKTKLKNLEIIEFEYFVNDLTLEYLNKQKIDFHYNDLSKEFVNTNSMLDGEKLSKGKQATFSGFKVLETRRLPENSTKVPHKNRPYNINKVDFANFFNKQFKSSSFYDLEDNEIETHKRSICFLALEYEDATGTKRFDIRHYKKTVNVFADHTIEETLSKKATEFFKNNKI